VSGVDRQGRRPRGPTALRLNECTSPLTTHHSPLTTRLIPGPIAWVEPAIVGAERFADGDGRLEVTGKIPMSGSRAVHSSTGAGGPEKVPGTRRGTRAGQKPSEAKTAATPTTATAAPGGCFLPRCGQEGQRQQGRPQKAFHDVSSLIPSSRVVLHRERVSKPCTKPLLTGNGTARRNYSRGANLAG
jgi:hypothetical protein